MRTYTNTEVDDIAKACAKFLAAHERRSLVARGATANEEVAIHELRWTLAAREREALAAAMGTAA